MISNKQSNGANTYVDGSMDNSLSSPKRIAIFRRLLELDGLLRVLDFLINWTNSLLDEFIAH